MYEFMISYSRRNDVFAYQLLDQLEKMGYKVWIDKFIAGGAVWWEEILTAIENTLVFVPILSNDFDESIYCKKEFAYAQLIGINTLPVALPGYSRKGELNIQCISAKYATLDNGTFQSFHSSYKKLDIQPVVRNPNRMNRPPCPIPPKRDPKNSYNIALPDFMDSEPLVVDDDKTVGYVFDRMNERGTPYMIVVDKLNSAFLGWATLGILIDKLPPPLQIIERIIGKDSDVYRKHKEVLEQRRAEKISHKNNMIPINAGLVSLNANLTILDAIVAFQKPHNLTGFVNRTVNIRAFPIINGTERFGALGYWHIIEYLIKENCIPRTRISDHMIRVDDIASFEPLYVDMSIKEVEVIVNARAWSHIAITYRDGTFFGMFRVEDLKRMIDSDFNELHSVSIREFIDSEQVPSVYSGDESLEEVIANFRFSQTSALPIVDSNHKLMGLLTHIQVLKILEEYLSTYYTR